METADGRGVHVCVRVYMSACMYVIRIHESCVWKLQMAEVCMHVCMCVCVCARACVCVLRMAKNDLNACVYRNVFIPFVYTHTYI